jgi:hypothetical protein
MHRGPGGGPGGHSLYSLLGVHRDCTPEELKRAYHKLALVRTPQGTGHTRHTESPTTCFPTPLAPPLPPLPHGSLASHPPYPLPIFTRCIPTFYVGGAPLGRGRRRHSSLRVHRSCLPSPESRYSERRPPPPPLHAHTYLTPAMAPGQEPRQCIRHQHVPTHL